MKKILIPFYILGKSIYTLKNILKQKKEGWDSIPIIVNVMFQSLYILFIEKLIFFEPSLNIISNYKDFCQWYFNIYILGIMLLSFWILEPLFLNTEQEHKTMKYALSITFVLLVITKIN